MNRNMTKAAAKRPHSKDQLVEELIVGIVGENSDGFKAVGGSVLGGSEGLSVSEFSVSSGEDKGVG